MDLTRGVFWWHMVGVNRWRLAGRTVAVYGKQWVGLGGALWWMLGWWGAVRRADMAVLCGALPIIGK